MTEKPSDRLTSDHVEWIIDGHRRSAKIGTAAKITFKAFVWLFKAFKWLAESLKWGVPLFVALMTAYHSGLFEGLINSYK